MLDDISLMAASQGTLVDGIGVIDFRYDIEILHTLVLKTRPSSCVSLVYLQKRRQAVGFFIFFF